MLKDIKMPQVVLGCVLDLNRYLDEMSFSPVDNRPYWSRYINNIKDLPKVPGFYDALKDNFRHWVLHHLMGEFLDQETLKSRNMYFSQPWWLLKFMTIQEHRRLHRYGQWQKPSGKCDKRLSKIGKI